MSRAWWLKRAVLAGTAVGGGGLLALWALPTMQESRKHQVPNYILLTCGDTDRTSSGMVHSNS